MATLERIIRLLSLKWPKSPGEIVFKSKLFSHKIKPLGEGSPLEPSRRERERERKREGGRERASVREQERQRKRERQTQPDTHTGRHTHRGNAPPPQDRQFYMKRV